jgi:hypothetical protein
MFPCAKRYILDVIDKYPEEEFIVLDKVENYIAYLRKALNNTVIKISISKLQLVGDN